MPPRARGIVVTGLYRSGTTLAERVLDGHPSICMVSQPVPLLHVRLKQEFLRSLGRRDAYPLGHRFLERGHRDDDLVRWLQHREVSVQMLADVEADLRGYSGWWTPGLDGHLADLGPGPYADVLERVCRTGASLRGPDKRTSPVVGCKEILIEDMLPYLAREGFVCAVVVRDLREVVVSLFGGAGEDIMGRWRPTLFHVRHFRRSVAAALRLRSTGRVATVRFPNLVSAPSRALADVTSMAGLQREGLPNSVEDLSDNDGNPWSRNSSFNGDRPELPADVTRYIELLAGPELVALGFADQWRVPRPDELMGLTEPVAVVRDDFDPDYSVDRGRLNKEVERLERLASGTGLDDEYWFLGAGELLRKLAGPPAGHGSRS